MPARNATRSQEGVGGGNKGFARMQGEDGAQLAPFWSCGLCNKVYRSKHIFKRHVQTHSPDHDIKCKDCGKAFMLRGDLTRHVRQHQNTRNYKCSHCPLGFARKYHRDKHVDQVHLKILRPEDMCKNHCGKRHSRHVYPYCTSCANVLGVKLMRGIRECSSMEACACFDFLNKRLQLDIVHIHFNDRNNTSIVVGHERDDYIPGRKVRADGYDRNCATHVYEYLGRFWHGHPGTEKYAKTMARLELFAAHGYIVHFIWSDEWKSAKALSEKLSAIHVINRTQE